MHILKPERPHVLKYVGPYRHTKVLEDLTEALKGLEKALIV